MIQESTKNCNFVFKALCYAPSALLYGLCSGRVLSDEAHYMQRSSKGGTGWIHLDQLLVACVCLRRAFLGGEFFFACWIQHSVFIVW